MCLQLVALLLFSDEVRNVFVMQLHACDRVGIKVWHHVMVPGVLGYLADTIHGYFCFLIEDVKCLVQS